MSNDNIIQFAPAVEAATKEKPSNVSVLRIGDGRTKHTMQAHVDELRKAIEELVNSVVNNMSTTGAIDAKTNLEKYLVQITSDYAKSTLESKLDTDLIPQERQAKKAIRGAQERVNEVLVDKHMEGTNIVALSSEVLSNIIKETIKQSIDEYKNRIKNAQTMQDLFPTVKRYQVNNSFNTGLGGRQDRSQEIKDLIQKSLQEIHDQSIVNIESLVAKINNTGVLLSDLEGKRKLSESDKQQIGSSIDEEFQKTLETELGEEERKREGLVKEMRGLIDAFGRAAKTYVEVDAVLSEKFKRDFLEPLVKKSEEF